MLFGRVGQTGVGFVEWVIFGDVIRFGVVVKLEEGAEKYCFAHYLQFAHLHQQRLWIHLVSHSKAFPQLLYKVIQTTLFPLDHSLVTIFTQCNRVPIRLLCDLDWEHRGGALEHRVTLSFASALVDMQVEMLPLVESLTVEALNFYCWAKHTLQLFEILNLCFHLTCMWLDPLQLQT